MTVQPRVGRTSLPSGTDDLGDLVHDLSQPLTTLLCTLELSLQRDKTQKALRDSVASALENALRLQRCLLRAHEAISANDTENSFRPIRADQLLIRVREEALPLTEAACVRLDSICDPVWVLGNKDKLVWGFISLIEVLLSSRVSAEVMALSGGLNGEWLEIAVVRQHAAGQQRAEQPLSPSSAKQLEILRRSFRAAGGELVTSSSMPSVIFCSVKLRLVESQ